MPSAQAGTSAATMLGLKKKKGGRNKKYSRQKRNDTMFMQYGQKLENIRSDDIALFKTFFDPKVFDKKLSKTAIDIII